MTDWLKIGKVVAPQGLKGEVRIHPDSDFPERFLQPGERWIRQDPSDPPTAITLVRGRYLESKNLYVVKFEGIDNRAEAESIRGYQLVVDASDRPQLAEGEFYLMDLVNVKVYDHDRQIQLGQVKRIANAGNDLLEIELLDSAKTRVLVPFVAEFFPLIDLRQGRIELAPMKGLLPEDLNL